MIKVRLVQPGHPDVELEPVPGDEAVLGRDKKCDLVVPPSFSYVSRRHLQVLRGLVIVDLSTPAKATTGTFINGEQISTPILLNGRTVSLAGRLDVLVEAAEDPELEQTLTGDAPGPSADALKHVRKELESERARVSTLAAELAEAREQLARASPEGDERLRSLQAEKEDLRRRLDTLKGELEGRELDASASLQVRLADQQLQEALRRNQELTARIGVLEERLRAAPARGAVDSAALGARDDELARLRAELEQVRKAALPPSEFFALMQRENAELRERLARFESGAVTPGLGTSDMFFQLQSDNAELRRRIEQLEGGPPAPPPRDSLSDTGFVASGELERLRAAQATAEAEIRGLRSELAGKGKAAPAPVPSTTTARSAPTGQKSILRVARYFAELDIEHVEAKEVTSTEDFFVLETLRFVREAERVITRLAGEMIQLYELHTILPNVEGNFRSLTRGVVNDPTDQNAQQELAKYLAELKRWLVVAVAAPRKAAIEFAMQLKQALTEEALTQGKPIPALKGRQAELWKRASDYLKELSPELIDDRLEKLGRHTAQLLLGTNEDAS